MTELEIWLMARPPFCKCGVRTSPYELKGELRGFVCHRCVKVYSLKAAGADFRKIGRIPKEALC